jgi:VanZ family protein
MVRMSSTNPPSDPLTLPLRAIAWWLGIGFLMLAVVLVLSLAPLPEQPLIQKTSDKLAHAAAFFLLLVWFSGIFRPRYRRALFIALLVFGASIEFMQSFTTYRSAEFLDLVFDAVGLGLAWALAAAGLSGWCLRLEARLSKGGSG